MYCGRQILLIFLRARFKLQFGASVGLKNETNKVLNIANGTDVYKLQRRSYFTVLQSTSTSNLLEKLHFRLKRGVLSDTHIAVVISQVSICK